MATIVASVPFDNTYVGGPKQFADPSAGDVVQHQATRCRPGIAREPDPAAQRIAATLAGEIQPLQAPGAGPQLDTVIGRALATDPAARYQSASEFLRDLQALVSGEAIAVLPNTLAIMPMISKYFDTR